MAKAEIIMIRDVPSPLRERMGQVDKEIQFRIDNIGPFLVYVPAESYTPAKAEELIRARLQEWGAVVGKVIEIK